MKKTSIYLIGGLPRCGKSTVAEYLLRTEHLNYSSLDMLQSLLNAVSPNLGIDVDMGHSEKIEKFFPVLHMLVKTHYFYNHTAVLEGDAIVPAHIVTLQKEYPVKALFLGDTSLTVDKLRSRTGTNDWISEKTDTELSELAQWIVEKSTWLREECKKHQMPYMELNEVNETSLKTARDLLLQD